MARHRIRKPPRNGKTANQLQGQKAALKHEVYASKQACGAKEAENAALTEENAALAEENAALKEQAKIQVLHVEDADKKIVYANDQIRIANSLVTSLFDNYDKDSYKVDATEKVTKDQFKESMTDATVFGVAVEADKLAASEKGKAFTIVIRPNRA
jgi:hypothetical protein